ncbi:MAG: YdcF family protein [Pirellulales bacterium]|nr:YdcF family protein [Pirellulales bacterium]
MPKDEALQRNRWRRRCFVVLSVWLLSTFLLSFPAVRGVVAYPLIVHHRDASGEAAYVMAGGYAYWERLQAASDLYHMGRVPRIIIMDERRLLGYNFTDHRSEAVVDRAISYLGWLGVPRDKITVVPVAESATFGSLTEARAVAKHEPKLNSIVVVTSAPHTRRSQLCFQRVFPSQVRVQSYAASEGWHGAENHAPIWLEYVKLAVYFIAA